MNLKKAIWFGKQCCLLCSRKLSWENSHLFGKGPLLQVKFFSRGAYNLMDMNSNEHNKSMNAGYLKKYYLAYMK